MNQDQPRTDIVRYWWLKAEESLASAERELIKPDLLNARWGKFYDQLYEDRQEGDYVELIEFEQAYVLQQLTQCREFLAALRPLISSLKST